MQRLPSSSALLGLGLGNGSRAEHSPESESRRRRSATLSEEKDDDDDDFDKVDVIGRVQVLLPVMVLVHDTLCFWSVRCAH